MRQGGEYFTDPQGPARRRYEALRAYFVEEMPAAEVADRFGYSTASVHQMATLLRGGKLQLFTQSRPGPKGPRIAGKVRDKALALRARDHSVTEIADALTASGTPVSAQTVWKILEDEGLPRRVRRDSNLKLQRLLVGELRNHQLATGAAGFNLDFHAIRHHGADAVLEDHYVPARSQRTRSVLTFFAQDHASTEMVYANADLTKAEQPREIIAFADYWHQVTGTDPGLLVLDSQLTTYAVLNELSGRGITWLTLRKRARSYRRPHLHEDQVTLKGIHASVRQIAVKNIGRPEPTLLITGDHTTPAANLFARYAERMLIENELDAYIGGFHLNALSSGVPLNVDLDTTLTVLAGNLYRLFARGLNRYQTTTPDTIWRHFLDATGTLHVTDDTLTCALNLRSNHPVLIQAGFADLDLAIPWWGGRTLRFTFPPR